MKILVAFDGTTSAVKALKYVLELFPTSDFMITYVKRVPYIDGAYGVAPVPYDPHEDQEILHSAKGICAQYRITPTTRSELGLPADVIVKHAEEEQVELVVLGAHNKGAIERLLLGSVSEVVARRAHCPILIVR